MLLITVAFGTVYMFCSLDQDCVKFGRNPEVVNIVLHSSVYANMISREHAEVRRSRLQDGTIAYHLYDRSLNGTYVNDFRVSILYMKEKL